MEKETKRVSLRDENGNQLRSKGMIPLTVQIGDLHARIRFMVVTRLSTDAILRCYFLDKNEEAIYPRKAVIVLKNGQVEQIYRRPVQENKVRYYKYKKNQAESTREEWKSVARYTLRKQLFGNPFTKLLSWPAETIPGHYSCSLKKVCIKNTEL